MSKIKGICAICSEFKELTFEHFPPQSCFNDKPTYIQEHEHLMDKSSHVYGKKRRSNRGFDDYTLCGKCNNIGAWYVNDYKGWVHSGNSVLAEARNNSRFIHTYTISPLGVLKQILSMFMSADKGGVLRDDKDLVKFILDPAERNLHPKYKIFSYYTNSKVKRFMGYCVVSDGSNISHWSEISYKPFGYLLAIDSKPAHKDMKDITDFTLYQYKEVSQIKLRMPFLETNTPQIGDYRRQRNNEKF